MEKYKYKVRTQIKEELEPEETLLDSEETKKEEKGRLEVPIKDTVFLIIFIFLSIFSLSLFVRAFYLIEIKGGEFTARATDNYLRVVYTEAPRGIIYSQDGTPLVKNVETKEEKKSFLRYYPENFYFSPILGYTREAAEEEIESDPTYYQLGDWIGKNGLEKTYEEYLRGEKGMREKIINAKGELLSDKLKKETLQGDNLILNINVKLQKKIYDEKKKRAGNKNAAAIALNPQDGSILALVSLPSDDNNVYSQRLSEEKLAKLEKEKKINNPNWVLSGLYPSGSTIKPLIAAAGLEERIITPKTQINCQGRVIIPNPWNPLKPSIKKDWRTHGITSLDKAIAQSCNVYFFTVGGGYGDIDGLGISRIKKYLDFFYLEEELKIDIPGEKVSFIPTPQWFKEKKEKIEKRQWSVADVYDVSIGQGYFFTTPLHLAVALSSIANGGKIYQPQIVNKIVNLGGKTIVDINPKVLRENFIQKENIESVRKAMRECVLTGSCRQLLSLPVSSAGKTGTAEAPGNKEPHAWFVSFAPYEKPKILLLVMIEYGGSGEKIALPIAKEVLKWYFTK